MSYEQGKIITLERHQINDNNHIMALQEMSVEERVRQMEFLAIELEVR